MSVGKKDECVHRESFAHICVDIGYELLITLFLMTEMLVVYYNKEKSVRPIEVTWVELVFVKKD